MAKSSLFRYGVSPPLFQTRDVPKKQTGFPRFNRCQHQTHKVPLYTNRSYSTAVHECGKKFLTHRVDPLNLPTWRKWTAIVVLCFCELLQESSERFDQRH